MRIREVRLNIKSNMMWRWPKMKKFISGCVFRYSLAKTTYPVVRPLFYYYETKNASKVRPFIDYVMSAEGQATVKKVGYIPVK